MLLGLPEAVRIASFASEFGDVRRSPETIEGVSELCYSKGIFLPFGALGCGSFWQMTQPAYRHIIKCVANTVTASAVPPCDVNFIVFSTVDAQCLDVKAVQAILEHVGLVDCVPILISLQQCVSSLAALNYGYSLFSDQSVDSVIVVAVDSVMNDRDRIQAFALLGDGVASCMIRRNEAAGLSLLSYAANIDFAGLSGRDSFESRKRVAELTINKALKDSGTRPEDIDKIFSCNVYEPILSFNAYSFGVDRGKLYTATSSSHAHCGNCDWMINLMHYREHVGITKGRRYLIQSSAPGLFACGVLKS